MNKKEFIKKLKLSLSKLDMPYYTPKDAKLNYITKSMFSVNLDFVLPFQSIKNLISFCEINNFCLAFSNRAELSGYHPLKMKKIKLPTR